VSNEFPCFSTMPTRLDPCFLFWYFRQEHVWSEVLGLSEGATPTSRNRLKEAEFLAMEIPLPSLAEQRRIVSRIEELTTQIHDARTLHAKAANEAEMLGSAYLQSAMLHCQGEDIELESACKAIIDNLHSNPLYAPSGIPCVRSSDVGWGTLNLATALRTDEAEYVRRTARGKPEVDDIVLVREGGGAGKCALVLRQQRFSLGQRVMMLRPDREKIVPSFFLYQLLSASVQVNQIQPLCKGSASPHLNIGSIRRFRLRLPPLPEQYRIVANLDALQAELNQVRQLKTEISGELETLLSAVLAGVFKDRL
jgi:type I restriction enzyme S subunit